jgi:histidine triad (HIT) family protein
MTTVEQPRTIYQKIFDGDLPAYKIYDDAENGFMAFLDIKPATPGHTLVVPREPIDRVYDLNPERSAQMGLLTQRISLRLQERLNPLRVTEHVYGFQIPHAHRMLVPSYERGDVAYLEDPARMQQPVDSAALEAMQSRLEFTDEEQRQIGTYLRQVGALIIDCT